MRLNSILVCLAVLGPLAACGPDKPPPVLDIPTPGAKGLAAVKALPAPYNAGDPAAGREAFVLCIECHSFKAETGNGKGPSLAGVYNRPAAARSDFAYSEVMRKSGKVWDVRQLDHWMFNPHESMPGTSMNFIGVRNDAKRYNLLSYIVAVSAEAAD